MDLKYDIMRHPNLALTADGGAPAYIHGADTHSYASITFDPELLSNALECTVAETQFELLSEEELEEYLNHLEEKHEKQHQE